MAGNAKSSAAKDAENANDAAAKKGRASEKNEEKVDKIVEAEVVATGVAEAAEGAIEGSEADGIKDMTSAANTATEPDTAEVVGATGAIQEPKKSRRGRKAKTASAARKTEGVKADDVMREESLPEEFQAEIREQIENCKNELEIALEHSIRQEFAAIVDRKLRAANRRRRAGAIVRDVIILLLVVAVGYFGWCLYDVRYFDWMGPRGEVAQDEQKPSEVSEPETVVKDTRWYINNYGYLFEDLQLKLNADDIGAYYLYSDDRKVSEIKPAYLLGMAYNKVMPTTSSAEGLAIPADNTWVSGTTVSAADLRTAFEGMFGTLDYFEKISFTHGCKKFTYVRESDSFVTDNGNCEVNSQREIVEEIDEMYEEGSVLYVLTTAAVYDKEEASLYSFDNLFKPAVINAAKDDLAKNRAVLNRYQYQFKKTGEKYYFSGVVKLR